MKIGIIGAGNVGTGLTKHLVPAGHEVMLSFSKDMAQLRAAAQALGASAGTVAEAVAFADVVVLCTPFAATAAALGQVGAVVGSKPLWDCTNALKPDMSGLAIGTTTSAGEEVQKLAPWAAVVKAIPPFAEVLHSGNTKLLGGAIGVFACSDNAAAKQVVSALLTALGVSVTDAGPLVNSRYAEAAGFLLIQLAYVQGLGARIGLGLVRDEASPPAVAAGEESTNLAIAKRFVTEGLGKADMRAFDACIDPNVVVTTGLSPKEPIRGCAAYKQVFAGFADAWPVSKFSIDEIFAAGDKVVVRFTATTVFRKDYFGVKATRQVVPLTEVHVYTLKNDKIVSNIVGAINLPFEFIMYPALKDAVLGDLETAK